MHELVKYAHNTTDALVVMGAISLFPFIWDFNPIEKVTDPVNEKVKKPTKIFLYGLIGMAGLFKMINYGISLHQCRK